MSKVKVDRFASLRFDRLEVLGRYIPSTESINLVRNEIKDKHAWVRFVNGNNIEVALFEQSMRNPEDDSDRNLRVLFIELYQNYQKQNELIGGNLADRICRSLAVINWFVAMLAESTEDNIQDLRKTSSEQLQRFKSTNQIEFDNSNETTKLRFPELRIFPEFEKSMQFLTGWYGRVSILSNENLELRELIIREKKILKQIHENREKSKNPRWATCHTCKKRFKVERGIKKIICDNCKNERRRKSQKEWEKMNRPTETVKRVDPVGWIKAFDGDRKLCQGVFCNDGINEFGRLRQVNSEYLCRECYLQSLAK